MLKMGYQCDRRRRISSRKVVSQRQQPCTPKFNSSWDGLVCSLPHIRNNKCTHPPFSKMWFAFPRCRGNPCSKNSLLGGKDALALSQATTHYLENLPLQKIICSYFVFFFQTLDFAAPKLWQLDALFFQWSATLHPQERRCTRMEYLDEKEESVEEERRWSHPGDSSDM